MRFADVEMGDHVIIIMDGDGNVVATKSFSITEGKSLTLEGDTVYARDSAVFTLTVKVDGAELKFVELNVGDLMSNKSGQNPDEANAAIQTGSASLRFWWYVLLELTAVYLMLCSRKDKIFNKM